jgi:hypothetical protein
MLARLPLGRREKLDRRAVRDEVERDAHFLKVQFVLVDQTLGFRKLK